MKRLIKANLIIKNASQLLTIKGFSKKPKTKEDLNKLEIIRNGAMAIKDKKIVWIGKSKDIKKHVALNRHVKAIDAENNLVMPGFVDPHTHLVFAGSRHKEYEQKIAGMSYSEIEKLNANSGIKSTVKCTRKTSKSELIDLALERLNIARKYGTTTIEIKSGYGLNKKDELKILEAIKVIANYECPMDIISTFLGAHTIPSEYKNRRNKYVDLIIEMLPEIYERGLAKYCDVFCDNLGFSLSETRKILEKARDIGFGLKMHAEQTSYLGGAELAAKLEATSADHLDYVSYDGIESMAQKNVVGILLPGVTFHLMEYNKQRRLVNLIKSMMMLGTPIALATDYNPGSCPTLSMQIIMKLAATLYKMNPAQIINAVTINAAHAVGMGNEVGSLEVGKKADVLICNIKEYQGLIDKFGYNLVTTVIKNGHIVN